MAADSIQIPLLPPVPKDLAVGLHAEELRRMRREQPRLYYWRAGLALLFLIICAGAGWFLFQNTETVKGWIDDAGTNGPWIYLGVLVTATVLMMPTPMLKILCGALFPSIWLAAAINFAASMIGGLIAFLLGRWMFRKVVKRAVENDPRARKIHAGLGKESLRLSMLVRLSPMIPDEWVNYILSAGPVSTRTFLTSCTVSIIFSIIYAWYGSILGDIALSGTGIRTMNDDPLVMGLTLLGIGATVIATAIISKVSLDSMHEIIGSDDDEE